MKDSKPFFYRIVAADFLAEVVKIPDGQHKEWVYQLALDLVAGEGSTAYAKKVIAEVQDYRKQQAENADKRWKDKKKREKRVALRAISEPNGSHMGGNGNNRSSNSNKEPIYSPDFLSFWEAYPKKTGKGAAWQEWQRYKPPLDKVLETLKWQVVSQKWKDGYILDPERYIKKRSWEDEKPQLTLLSAEEINKQRTLEAY